MNQIPELESLNPFRLFFAAEPELPSFKTSPDISQTPEAHRDFCFIPRRERIDSEDFTLPVPSKTRREPDFAFVEAPAPSHSYPSTDPLPRRKASGASAIEPALIGLEVR